jgi:hypothetical protein
MWPSIKTGISYTGQSYGTGLGIDSYKPSLAASIVMSLVMLLRPQLLITSSHIRATRFYFSIQKIYNHYANSTTIAPSSEKKRAAFYLVETIKVYLTTLGTTGIKVGGVGKISLAFH